MNFDGRYYQLQAAPCEPKPIQKPHPPIVIGGEGEQTLRVIAQYAVLVFMPGPNTLYIVARSLQQGLMAGMVSSLGVQVGTFFHVAATAFGLTALLLSSAILGWAS